MTSRQGYATWAAAGLARSRREKRGGRKHAMIGHPHIRGSWFRGAAPPQDDRSAGAASFCPRASGHEPRASGWVPRIRRQIFAVPALLFPPLRAKQSFVPLPRVVCPQPCRRPLRRRRSEVASSLLLGVDGPPGRWPRRSPAARAPRQPRFSAKACPACSVASSDDAVDPELDRRSA